MTGRPHFDWGLLGWRAAAIVAGLAFFLAAALPVGAASNDRTLWLHHTHTGKTGKFTYKKNGKYDAGVLRELNVFLADWRTGTPTKMDPALFDLLWEVYQEVGGRQPYNIVSSYREPKTNAMLRASSSGVAENSQHMLGKAMDVFIPGVKLSDLRAAAMRHQVGGVGYYPTSGSPFVHMDTGSVRAWPRMTRAQLQTVFPDGRTLHLPVDGKPLSSQGRAYAQAEWNKCRMVPCNGLAPRGATIPDIQIAALDPAQRTVSTIDVVAPMPMLRRPAAVTVAALDPAATPFNNPSVPLASVVPFSKTPALMVATRGALPPAHGSALNAIATLEPAPQPRALLTPRDDEVLTAYAPSASDRRALDLLIASETAPPVIVATAAVPTTNLRPGGTSGMSPAVNIFDMTWTAVNAVSGRSAIANTLVSAALDRDDLMVGLKPRAFDLVAPEIDHVNETLVEPVPMTHMHFAELYEPEGYLDNAAELGPMAARVALEPDIAPPARYDVFVVSRPLLVAAR